jgi:hypothetical protein
MPPAVLSRLSRFHVRVDVPISIVADKAIVAVVSFHARG